MWETLTRKTPDRSPAAFCRDCWFLPSSTYKHTGPGSWLEIFGGQESSCGASSTPTAVQRSNSVPGLRIKLRFKPCQEKLLAALLSPINYAKLRRPLLKRPQPARAGEAPARPAPHQPLVSRRAADGQRCKGFSHPSANAASPARSWGFAQEQRGAGQGGFHLKPARMTAASHLRNLLQTLSRRSLPRAQTTGRAQRFAAQRGAGGKGNLRRGRKAKTHSTVTKTVTRSRTSRQSRREVGFQGLVHTRHRDDPETELPGAWLIRAAAKAPPGPGLRCCGFPSHLRGCRAIPAER